MTKILNLTGFRKALKKYEKITKNKALDAYMKEKVGGSMDRMMVQCSSNPLL